MTPEERQQLDLGAGIGLAIVALGFLALWWLS